MPRRNCLGKCLPAHLWALWCSSCCRRRDWKRERSSHRREPHRLLAWWRRSGRPVCKRKWSPWAVGKRFYDEILFYIIWELIIWERGKFWDSPVMEIQFCGFTHWFFLILGNLKKRNSFTFFFIFHRFSSFHPPKKKWSKKSREFLLKYGIIL